MGYPVLIRSRESRSISGPCIVVRPAERKSSDKRSALANAHKAGEIDRYMADNSMSKSSIKGMHSTMMSRTWVRGGKKLQEYLKYAVELYFDGMTAHNAIAKAMNEVYGKV